MIAKSVRIDTLIVDAFVEIQWYGKKLRSLWQQRHKLLYAPASLLFCILAALAHLSIVILSLASSIPAGVVSSAVEYVFLGKLCQKVMFHQHYRLVLEQISINVDNVLFINEISFASQSADSFSLQIPKV